MRRFLLQLALEVPSQGIFQRSKRNTEDQKYLGAFDGVMQFCQLLKQPTHKSQFLSRLESMDEILTCLNLALFWDELNWPSFKLSGVCKTHVMSFIPRDMCLK